MNNIYKGIKSGADPNDTYSKMLQEIQLCTPAVAKSVMNEYPTIQLLHQKYKELDQPTGEMLLSSLEVIYWKQIRKEECAQNAFFRLKEAHYKLEIELSIELCQRKYILFLIVTIQTYFYINSFTVYIYIYIFY